MFLLLTVNMKRDSYFFYLDSTNLEKIEVIELCLASGLGSN
jgi:hypothetical protein